MNILGITWRCAGIDDVEILHALPEELVTVLGEINGFIVHAGAVHVRGACLGPEWHSLRVAMHGPQAFHRLYGDVLPSDIPFAQDQVGDQFLLRSGSVCRLAAETGEIEPFCANLRHFLGGLQGDVEDFFTVGLSQQLEPGELLHACPPFCVKESGAGASLQPCPASQVILFHADFARQIRNIPDGGKIEIRFTDLVANKAMDVAMSSLTFGPASHQRPPSAKWRPQMVKMCIFLEEFDPFRQF